MRELFFNGRGELRSGWKAGGFVLLFIAVGWGLAQLAKLMPSLGALAQRGSVWTAAVIVAAVSAACLWMEGRHPLDFGLRFDRRWALEFLLGTAGGVVLLVAVALAIRATGAFHWERNPPVGGRQLLLWAGFYLGVAFNEEILVRGYAFQRLARGGLGVWGTQALFALIFAMGHWGNPNATGTYRVWGTLNIALAAILLGLAMLRTGSLALPIGLHLGWNWTQGTLLGFRVSGTDSPGWWRPVLDSARPAWSHGGEFGLEATLACAVLCTLAILLLAKWRGRDARMGVPPEPT
jgi:membrane protease YdiL (CAAX protease family)